MGAPEFKRANDKKFAQEKSCKRTTAPPAFLVAATGIRMFII